MYDVSLLTKRVSPSFFAFESGGTLSRTRRTSSQFSSAGSWWILDDSVNSMDSHFIPPLLLVPIACNAGVKKMHIIYHEYVVSWAA
jgi:hypothetical protein